MTLQSWKNEFYPVKPSKRMSKKSAIEHSLRKWIGLMPKNLKKHGLVKCGKFIQEKSDSTTDLQINDESCALCVKFIDNDPPDNENECHKCPLCKSLGKPCDASVFFEKSPYTSWSMLDDPKPMIKALKKALEENQ